MKMHYIKKYIYSILFISIVTGITFLSIFLYRTMQIKELSVTEKAVVQAEVRKAQLKIISGQTQAGEKLRTEYLTTVESYLDTKNTRKINLNVDKLNQVFK